MMYRSTELAILVPTKDRPGKLRNLLDSLAGQTQSAGRILIVDGGASVRDVVMAYADRLPVEHHLCRPPGQIRQRNMGIALIDDRTPLVASLDDDIVFEPDAIEQMIAFWNLVEAETAAVAFNQINTPREPDTWLRRLFLLSGPQPGRVLRSGFTTSNNPAAANHRTDWVSGGAAVWRRDILRQHPHRELPSRWAIGEDVIFSYRISRRHPMYVCAASRVRHEHVFDYGVARRERFHGRTQTLWLFHFVESTPDLSVPAFLWAVAGSALGRGLAAAARADRRHLEFAIGQMEALASLAAGRLRGKDSAAVIERDARSAGGG
ncbi:MAG: glycosyltransferase [Acidobacteria bacterium]|nr:glycosyltransferase [Acidobacteriota bacterium]